MQVSINLWIFSFQARPGMNYDFFLSNTAQYELIFFPFKRDRVWTCNYFLTCALVWTCNFFFQTRLSCELIFFPFKRNQVSTCNYFLTRGSVWTCNYFLSRRSVWTCNYFLIHSSVGTCDLLPFKLGQVWVCFDVQVSVNLWIFSFQTRPSCELITCSLKN